MELTAIEKHLHKVDCPACRNQGSLQVTLSCSSPNERCQIFFRCAKCNTSLLYNAVEEELDRVVDETTEFECDLVSRTCMPRFKGR